MKKIALPFVLLLFIGCSISVIKDSFDNSTLVKLSMDKADFSKWDGKIEIAEIVFSKEYKPGSDIEKVKLFCKFEGYRGEVLEGNTIEIKIDDVIHKLKLIETRSGVIENIKTSSSTSYTWIGAFTYTDVSRSNVHILAMEAFIPAQILDAMRISESIVFRIYTKNIDGISKNTFECSPYSRVDIKKFIGYKI